jgi:hypothetical protein
MQSNGYLNAKPRPGMMMAVIAIHAAGIGGLMMIAPTVVDRVTKTLTVEQIDLPVIPPEVIDDPAPKSRAKTVRWIRSNVS